MAKTKDWLGNDRFGMAQDFSHTAPGDVNGGITLKMFDSFFKKINMKLANDPASLFLSMHARELKTYTHTKTCT